MKNKFLTAGGGGKKLEIHWPNAVVPKLYCASEAPGGHVLAQHANPYP